MKNWNNILEKLKKTINLQGIDSFHVLEEQVPLEEQKDFFEAFEMFSSKRTPFVTKAEIDILFSPDESIERKKKSLVLLSSIADVTAYRAIETYQSSPLEPALKNWSSIALLGARISLDSELSGKPQVYISSGLGGQGKKLRFFALFSTSNRADFTELQKQLVEREFRFQLSHATIDIESFEIKNNYFTIVILIPFEEDGKAILQMAIDECNQFGGFLDTRFLFTNVKLFSDEEIQRILSHGMKVE